MNSSVWQKVGRFGSTNFVLEGDGFHISYNPNLSASLFGAPFDSDDGGPETALCKDDAFFILNGDYRDAYEKLATMGYAACKEFYDQQAAHSDSSWSVGESTSP
jgi:hypothetical protein